MKKFIEKLPSNAVFSVANSPVGDLLLVADDKKLLAVLFDKKPDRTLLSKLPDGEKNEVIKETKLQLKEYFAGKRTKFDLPLHMLGTEFQRKTWGVLRKIPYGKTLSYQEQAIKLGDPNKCRAVGGANGKNPLSIVVPCHRVLGKSGALTGFGGGMDKKKFLLELEGYQTA